MVAPLLFGARAKHYFDAIQLAMEKFHAWSQVVDLQPSEVVGYSTQTGQGQFDGAILWFHTITLALVADRPIDLGTIREVANRYKEMQDKALHTQLVWEQPQQPAYECRPSPTGKRDEETIRNIIKGQNARALKMGARGTFTYEEWMLLCVIFEDRCACCNEQHDRLCIDHIIALARGGTNFIENLQPLCRACNSGKHAKPTDYRGDRAYTFLEALENLRKSS